MGAPSGRAHELCLAPNVHAGKRGAPQAFGGGGGSGGPGSGGGGRGEQEDDASSMRSSKSGGSKVGRPRKAPKLSAKLGDQPSAAKPLVGNAGRCGGGRLGGGAGGGHARVAEMGGGGGGGGPPLARQAPGGRAADAGGGAAGNGEGAAGNGGRAGPGPSPGVRCLSAFGKHVCFPSNSLGGQHNGLVRDGKDGIPFFR